MARPRLDSEGQRELDKMEGQIAKTQESVSEAGRDVMTTRPQEMAPPEISKKEMNEAGEIYLKPVKTIKSKEGFNEKFRSDYEYAQEYVRFIAENYEIRGDKIELWTKPYPGMPAEFWEVPPNKAVWAPRHVAEQIKRKFYHRLVMEDRPISQDGRGTYYGAMTVDSTIHRLNAFPAAKNAQISMHKKASNF